MTPGANSAGLKPATLGAEMERIYAELRTLRTRCEAITDALLAQQVAILAAIGRVGESIPRDTADHVATQLPDRDLMRDPDRQLDVSQVAAFLGISAREVRRVKHDVGFTKGKAQSSPLFFRLDDVKRYAALRNARGVHPPPSVAPVPACFTKPKRQRRSPGKPGKPQEKP
ncbi:MAG: hypothetical protein QOG15_1983 [Solirubrobacteraceae bacterium]|jgi:AraC-like DNA-binding protein|nr:hypothetical protein [Solirubrobacteraceae bacterium]